MARSDTSNPGRCPASERCRRRETWQPEPINVSEMALQCAAPHPALLLSTTGLHEQHAASCVAQPRRDHAPGGAAAEHDDVVGLLGMRLESKEVPSRLLNALSICHQRCSTLSCDPEFGVQQTPDQRPCLVVSSDA